MIPLYKFTDVARKTLYILTGDEDSAWREVGKLTGRRIKSMAVVRR